MSKTFSLTSSGSGGTPAFNFTFTVSDSPSSVAQGFGEPSVQAYALTGASGSFGTDRVTGLFSAGAAVGGDVYEDNFSNFAYNNLYKLSATGDFGTPVMDGIDDSGIEVTLQSGNHLVVLFEAGVFKLTSITPSGETTTYQYDPAAVSATAPCYAAGTRILAERGEIAVEDLVVGENVVTADGALKPIRWIGRRTLEIERHPRPEAVRPVRIAAGALGEGKPKRDLLVSPEHALWLDGGLAPAHSLINGATIRQEARTRITYFHLELDAHEMLMAEGVAAESYLDCDNRRGFDNADVTDLHPDWLARAQARAFLPPARLAALREAFAARAKALGRGAEVAAFDAERHALARAPRQNFVRNPRGEGSPPQFWAAYAPKGLVATWTGGGEEAGLPFVELRIAGRALQDGCVGIYPQPGPAAPARPDEDWTFSCFLSRAAGDFGGVAGVNLYVDELDAQGRYLGGLAYARPLPQHGELRLQRMEASHRLREAGAAALTAYVQFKVIADQEIDLSLRIGSPQIERGAYASDPILPPPGEPGVSIRAA